ncbi:MAG TPA: SagB/ThcOx family dehydrogenase, partial [Rhodocyclaceae bacterium]|nr:SagB/ThcOx family dehydrogenase [Rhodocyclaceae bacterium]
MTHAAPWMQDAPSAELAAVVDYHQRSKHRPQRYAPSLGYLDWANQPNPFRHYTGAPRTPLRRNEPTAGAPPWFDDLYGATTIATQAPDFDSISQLLFDAFALSAWKRSGASRWSLRCNPSSGNLHPTEVYLLLPDGPALYHYDPLEHALEQRLRLAPSAWASLSAGLPPHSFLVGLSSIHWREAWKYGERAYRYCQHDLGHAMAQLAYAAAALGWQVRELPLADTALATLLGIDRAHAAEAESPGVLLRVSPPAPNDATVWQLPTALLDELRCAELAGVANRLSAENLPWDAIDQVAHACLRAAAAPLPPRPAHPVATETSPRPIAARHIFRTRRSAVAMDGRTALPLADFVRLMQRLTPSDTVPWNLQSWRPALHPLFFVHRVAGLAPGVYLLCREAQTLQRLRAALGRFSLEGNIAGVPATLSFYRLIAADVREFARLSNCGQEIAADGAFSVAMLAEFDAPLRAYGAWMYRRLYWEAGMLGQVLYLEAEAAGLRGTGIGCFFDDTIHEALGLEDMQFQSLYGFTVG